MPDPLRRSLSPFLSQQLGGERAQAAVELRQLLLSAGLGESLWPRWIDARPGLLSTIWIDGDAEPPLGLTMPALCVRYGELLKDGLAALKLLLGAQAVGFCTSKPALHAELTRLCAQTTILVRTSLMAFPSQPELDARPQRGRAWVVPVERVAQVGALLLKRPPPQLCSVVGAVALPQALDLTDDDPSAWTPRELLRRCGGSPVAAWVALVGGALTGTPWSADAKLPRDVSHLLILPADHELLTRRRLLQDPLARIANACLGCDLCSAFCPESIQPHLSMQGLGRQQPLPPAGLPGCSGCGACSVACPAGLLPASLLAGPRESWQAAIDDAEEPPPLPIGRLRIPTELLLSRLGLLAYQH